jgi:hypothetical protein
MPLPPLGGTWIVTLECQGTLPGPRFLDGRTHDGTVALADGTAFPFTGTHWAVTTLAPGIVMFECRGHLSGSRFLDGQTATATVGLAPFVTPPFSGARWLADEAVPGIFTFKCLGELEGQGNRFLDGRTAARDVALAPMTSGGFTGTRWQMHIDGELFTLQCLGDVPGVRFLDGRTHDQTVGLAPTTADPFSGTLWIMSASLGTATLMCLGQVDGPARFLDGRTHDGTVGLAPHTGAPFSGTYWQIVPLQFPNGAVALRCLGVTEGRGFHGFLDGRTHDGTVGLSRTLDPPFTGTRWRLTPPSIVMGPDRAIDGDDNVLAVHAALLKTNKIVYFGGDEHDRAQHDERRIDHSRTFDTTTFLVRRAPSPSTDVFCCGHSMLADGRLLVAGGTEKFLQPEGQLHHDHFPGLHDCWLFDPDHESWIRVARLISAGLERFARLDVDGEPGGRWYPTLVTLGNGQVLASAGHPSNADNRHSHHIPERYSPAGRPRPFGPPERSHWTLLPQPPDTASEFEGRLVPNVYPRLHLLPDGRVFCSTPLGTVPQSQIIDAFTNTRTPAGPPPPEEINIGTFFSQDGSSVLLPLLPEEEYRARVLLCGGNQPVVMDLGAPTHQWLPTSPRHLVAAPGRYEQPNPLRFHGNAILLPTGDVFVCGGCAVSRKDATAVLESELYHPRYRGRADSWESLSAASVARNYHSVALLLPDGRIWTAGSNHDGQQGHATLEPRIEILSPPYVARRDRPVIDSAVETIMPEQSFVIRTPSALTIERVVLLRAGSVTHAFNSDQRYVGLSFFATGPTLIVKGPPSHNVAPPGFYLLFIVDDEDRPSAGWFVRVL